MVADWTDDYFERGYAQRWGVLRVTAQVRLEAGGIWTRCRLQPGDIIADVGCGFGRHALALAERGALVVGADTSASVLRHARVQPRHMKLAAHWVQGDMRRVPLRSGSCDAVVIMDALGFFETEEEDTQALREAARVLKPGGRVAVKVVNGAPIVGDFRDADRDERDGTAITMSRTLLRAPYRMIERVSISLDGVTDHYERRQRLYCAEEISAALRGAGFADIEIAAHAAGGPFEPESSRLMWIVARATGR